MRKSGILLHISSLPSRHGIGKLGQAAYDFVKFLQAAGVSCWQILPLSPTSYGDSPYQSCSVHAGNPYFIDFDLLAAAGLLTPADYDAIDWGEEAGQIDYEKLYTACFAVLRLAFRNRGKRRSAAYRAFLASEAHWLDDYALFMALKQQHGGKPWMEWDAPLAQREPKALAAAKRALAEEMEFYRWIQFQFFTQWDSLRAYANQHGISIIGDIPIYAAMDSVEVWATPELFQLDGEKRPVAVAGCPPDPFAKTGQLWGNPLYDWNVHAADGYAWWIDRLRHAARLYDTVRIDHFRGFERYYAIPYGEKTAEHGTWEKGPDYALFQAVRAALGRQSIIAEDLGNITPAVRRMLKKTGFPGMKVLQFAFDSGSGNPYLPHNFTTPNCVVYTGTHDNQTLLGWVQAADKTTLKYAKTYLHAEKKSELPDAMLRAAWGSIADLAVAQMQDFLHAGSEGRMNTPSTLGCNWQYRTDAFQYTEKLAKRIRKLNETYGRAMTNPEQEEKG